MSSVSFRSTYAVPLNNTQNPFVPQYQQFMQESYPLRKKDEPAAYSERKREYYVHVQEDNNGINDRVFEQMAAFYNIKVNKVPKSKITGKTPLYTKQMTSENIKNFVNSAIQNGAKHSIVNKKSSKLVYLYTDDGKTYGVYKFDKAGKLMKRLVFVDGQLDSIDYFDKNEELKNIDFVNQQTNKKARVDARILELV